MYVLQENENREQFHMRVARDIVACMPKDSDGRLNAPHKISMINLHRNASGSGLKEAKESIEEAIFEKDIITMDQVLSAHRCEGVPLPRGVDSVEMYVFERCQEVRVNITFSDPNQKFDAGEWEVCWAASEGGEVGYFRKLC